MFKPSFFENLVADFQWISSYNIVNWTAIVLMKGHLTDQDKVNSSWFRTGVGPPMDGTSLDTDIASLHMYHNVVIKSAVSQQSMVARPAMIKGAYQSSSPSNKMPKSKDTVRWNIYPLCE